MESGYALTVHIANLNAILIIHGGAKIRALKIGNNDLQTMQLFNHACKLRLLKCTDTRRDHMIRPAAVTNVS